MAMKIPVPAFGGEKSYTAWKVEVDAWRRVHEKPFGKKNIALSIALSLPEGSEARELVFNNIGTEGLQLDEENGFDQLIEILDKRYQKDELSEARSAWKKYDDVRLKENGSMENYIAEFDKAYKNLSKYKCTISSPILGFTLLDRANLDLREQQIVLTDVKFDDIDNMYENMKKALRKYFADGYISKTEKVTGNENKASAENSVRVKTESEECEEVNMVNRGRSRSRGYRGGYSRGPGRYYGRNPNSWNDGTRKCFVCGSDRHLAAKCPKNVYMTEKESGKEKTDGEEIEEAHIAEVFASSQMINAMTDSINYALLDSCCSSTVCGIDWLKCYIEILPDGAKAKIVEYKSNTKFKFGDGKIVQSLKQIKLPVIIAGIKTYITTDVVNCDIPLLWSKGDMKKAGMTLDFSNDSAYILNRWVKLQCTSSGHYKLPLFDKRLNERMFENVMYTMTGDEKEKKQKVKKLHHQFGHPSSKRLVQLLKDAGVNDDMCLVYAEEVSNNCEICKKYKKTPSRPVVGLNLAKDFNDVVSLDLKEWKANQIYFLHLTDMATRFTRSGIIYSKDPKVIVEKVIELWLGTGLGPPRKFLADNGGEFANSLFLEMCENYNIHVMHTAAFSPFSNGLNERNHAIVDEMVRKILAQQPQCSLEIALAWAINAKNCLQMVNGYSPYQLVYGRNPNLPNVASDKLPALEGTTTSQMLAQQLNACHAARKAFIEVEASEKIRRALRHQNRGNGVKYQMGDLVYFKRDENNEWKGPAKVIGVDGKTIILKYGSYIIRVHETKLQLTNDGDIVWNEENFDSESNKSNEKTKTDKNNDKKDNEISEKKDDEMNDRKEDEINAESIEEIKGEQPKIGDTVKYLDKETGLWKTVKIHSRAGKKKGRYSSWRNVEDEDGKIMAIDWNKEVRTWKLLSNEEAETVFLTADPCMTEEMKAKTTELDNWRNFGVYEEVKNTGQKTISVRWVITEKEKEGQQSLKARLVARGFEETCDIQSDSPTASKELMRIFLSILCSKGWDINSLDVKAAFLQSKTFDRDVFLKPPKEANCAPDVLWKLRKCVYGLNDAARSWYDTVKKSLQELKCTQVKTEPAAFFWYDGDELGGVFMMHVDDFMWGGSSAFEEKVINKMRKKFQIGDQSNSAFKYIGLEVDQNSKKEIHLNQNKYSKTIKTIQVTNERAVQKEELCTEKEKEEMRSVIGQLGWLSSNSRPDLSYDVLELSCKIKNPRVADLLMTNKCVRKAQMYENSLKYPNLGELTKSEIVVFSDASYANLPNGSSSAGGFLAFLVGENGRSAPIYWESKTIRRVVQSTLAAETLSATKAVDMAYYIGSILSQVLMKSSENKIPIKLIVDNKSLFDNVHSTKNVAERRLRIDLALLKELVSDRCLTVCWTESSNQIADALTKRGVNPANILSLIERGKLLALEGNVLFALK